MQFVGSFWNQFRGTDKFNEYFEVEKNTTLETLLDDENVISELKSENPKLLTFLNKENVEKLIELVTVFPPSDDDNRGRKFPFIASEIFSCETPQILDSIVKEPSLLEKFFLFLTYEPLNLTLAGYFSKLLISLISKYPSEILKFMDDNGSLIPLSQNIKSKSISDIVLKILILNVQDNNCLETRKKLFSLILDQFNSEDICVTTFVYEIINEFINKGLDADSWKEIFRIAITQEDSVILKAAKSDNTFRVYSAVRVLTDILNSTSCDSFLRVDVPDDDDDSSMDLDNRPSKLLINILDCCENFLSLLPIKKSTWESTSRDVVVHVLGKERLAIVMFFTELLKFDFQKVEEKIISLNIIPEVVDLLFQFEQNSFLHTQIERFISIICLHKGTNYCYTESLVKNSLSKLISKENFKKPYVGFLIRIFNIFEKNRENNQKLGTWLSENDEWKQFSLSVNEKNELFNKKLGGNTEPPALSGPPIIPTANNGQFPNSTKIPGPPMFNPSQGGPPPLPNFPGLPPPPFISSGTNVPPFNTVGPPPNFGGPPPNKFMGPPLLGGPPQLLGGPPQLLGGPPQLLGGPPQLLGGPPPFIGGPPPPNFTGPPPMQSSPNQHLFGHGLPPPNPSVSTGLLIKNQESIKNSNEENEDQMDIVKSDEEGSKVRPSEDSLPESLTSEDNEKKELTNLENSNELFFKYWKFGNN